ncbi:MAG: trehalose-6-phosphate synthase [Chlamydiales bacterium]|nr:trehalose-6-phosphate synthase [Chlamydiales bacterium]
MSEPLSSQRIIIASNRLPFEMEAKNGDVEVHGGSGGLVTALAPVLKDRGGLWVGWPGTVKASQEKVLEAVDLASQESGFEYAPVFISEDEVDQYYHGFANEIVWPLFHDLQSLCNFVPSYWNAYQRVNARFAEEISRFRKPGDFIWVHDYHLMLAGKELRQLGVDSKIGFFLHIPFPPLDIFLKLPWRTELLNALLRYDLIGFQTNRDKRNFIQCVRMLRKDVVVKVAGAMHVCSTDFGEVRVGAFPISIDFKEFSDQAASEEVEKAAWLLHEQFPNLQLILSIDRLDYTKGIPYRLEAIRSFLEAYPEFHKKVCFIQAVIPSREVVPKYQELKNTIDKLVGKINSQFTKEGWVPIHYAFRSLPRAELLAHYRTCEVGFITPVKDGMNLVCKEYVASNIDENGVLLLSEFAGAASQMQNGAVPIHPYDVIGMAKALHQALTMSPEERKLRMRRMRRQVSRNDIWRWTESFLSAAVASDLKTFPLSIPD